MKIETGEPPDHRDHCKGLDIYSRGKRNHCRVVSKGGTRSDNELKENLGFYVENRLLEAKVKAGRPMQSNFSNSGTKQWVMVTQGRGVEVQRVKSG
jgi:hypothetical protein